MNKLLVICGPTATGKTKLALKLAQEFNGELISADSRQVYKGMDIGTGKDHPRETTIYLVDVVNPGEQFSAADYVKLATKTIKDIWNRKKLPILVGGTGFYIKGVIDGIATIGIPPDWELRRRLGYDDTKILGERLRRLDPRRWQRMSESDRKNPRRLIRAIEVVLSNKKLESQRTQKLRKALKVLFIGLKAPNKALYQRIDKRVDERVKKGIAEEIKSLLAQGYSWDNSVLGETIGYKEFKPCFEKKASLEEAVQKWKYDEHDYARRQMTWFRKALRTAQGVWFDITKTGFEKKVVKLVRKWYSKDDA